MAQKKGVFIRGTYFDIRQEAPGPVVYNMHELCSAIQSIQTYEEDFKGRIESFNNKYLTYERNDSCEEILRRVFPSMAFYSVKWKIKSTIKRLIYHSPMR